MEPVTTITGAWTIAKTAGELSKKLYDVAKTLKDRDAKQQVDEILDGLRELKQSASELEDQNRAFREKLRFKSDDYVFRTPFRYRKDDTNQPLCVKCFAEEVEAQMSEPKRDGYKTMAGLALARSKGHMPGPKRSDVDGRGS